MPPPLILCLTPPELTPSSAGRMAQVVSQMLFRAMTWSCVCKGQSFRLGAGTVPCPELRANSRRGRGSEQQWALPSEDGAFQAAVQALVKPVPGTGSLRNSSKVPASDSKLLPTVSKAHINTQPAVFPQTVRVSKRKTKQKKCLGPKFL